MTTARTTFKTQKFLRLTHEYISGTMNLTSKKYRTTSTTRKPPYGTDQCCCGKHRMLSGQRFSSIKGRQCEQHWLSYDDRPDTFRAFIHVYSGRVSKARRRRRRRRWGVRESREEGTRAKGGREEEEGGGGCVS